MRTLETSNVRQSTHGLRWRQFRGDESILARIETVCSDWEGVPYQLNGRSLRGIDCVNFGSVFCDAVCGETRDFQKRRFMGDTYMNSPRRALSVVKRFMESYPAMKVEDGIVRPGDVIVQSDGAPMHIMCVSHRPSNIIEATRSRNVSLRAMLFPESAKVTVYRMNELCI
jgi:hypothetical protein